MALEIGKGDEVITPSLTWVSTSPQYDLLVRCSAGGGCRPRYADGRLQSDRSSHAPRTKAIIPVHYAGAPANIDAIRAIGETLRHRGYRRCCPCQIGTYYKKADILAQRYRYFSFHAIKNITCAEVA